MVVYFQMYFHLTFGVGFGMMLVGVGTARHGTGVTEIMWYAIACAECGYRMERDGEPRSVEDMDEFCEVNGCPICRHTSDDNPYAVISAHPDGELSSLFQRGNRPVPKRVVTEWWPDEKPRNVPFGATKEVIDDFVNGLCK